MAPFLQEAVMNIFRKQKKQAGLKCSAVVVAAGSSTRMGMDKLMLPLGDILRPFVAALPAVALGVFCYRLLCLHAGDSPFLLLPVLPLVLVCYLALALPAGALTKRELLALPFGERLCPLLEKTKLLK